MIMNFDAIRQKPTREKLKGLELFSPIEAAYVAGFIDADGCILFSKQKTQPKGDRRLYYFTPQVSITNRNLSVMQWLYSRCGKAGTWELVKNSLKNKNWSDAYSLKYSNTYCQWILFQVEKYMIVKRENALLLLHYFDLNRSTCNGGIQSKQRYEKNLPVYIDIYCRIKQLNQKGHYRISKKELGELKATHGLPTQQKKRSLGSPNERDEGNQQPSRLNVVELVKRKVHRLMGEDIQTNNPNTSAQHESEDIVGAYGKP